MKRLLVYTIAFLTGAVLLGLEIVASRVLAPYFGNSIFVWGSLISVFLLALSIGYFWGGSMADRYPSFTSLAMVVFVASAFVLVLPLVYLPASRFMVSLDLEFRMSVLLTSMLFFLLPSVLIGMVSPYIIKLSASELAVIGQTAGNIYSVSTMGSITGALGVSFFLIPVMGTRPIILLAAGMLILAGLLCLSAQVLAVRTSGRTSFQEAPGLELPQDGHGVSPAGICPQCVKKTAGRS